jgi:acetyl esterase/lipase
VALSVAAAKTSKKSVAAAGIRVDNPSMTQMHLMTGLVLLVSVAASCDSAEFRSDIEYGNVDGESLKLDASIPEGEGPFPIAILVHGGGWGGGDKAVVHVPPTKPLTDANITWFSIDYRLAPKHRWPACSEDVRTAIRWVKEHAAEFKGDPASIALIGYSAGGHLAAYATATADDQVRPQALVVLAGPTDLVADCERRSGVSPALQALFNHDIQLDDEIRAKLRDASPLTHLTSKLPPTLLIHGNADESVPYSQSEVFQAKLKELGVPCELITIPGGSHRIREWDDIDPEYEQAMVTWLNEQLPARP